MEIRRPEVTEKYIRIPVWRGYSKIVSTIVISESKGIKALLGQVPNTDKTKVATYLFLRAKGWTMAKAKAWIKEHSSKSNKSNAMEQTRKFSFSMPIVKAWLDKATGKRYLEGVASTTDKDLHGDRMSPSAIESMADSIKQLKKKSGTLNAEHEKSWQAELGEIMELRVSGKKELVMKAELNETSKANDLWYMLTEKRKKLGLSVGGFVKAFRIEIDEKTKEYLRVFEEVILDHIAVVSQPANPNTWVSAIAKSVNGVQLGAVQNQEEIVFNLLNEEEMTKNKAQDTELEKNEEETTEEETTEETQDTVSEGQAGSEDETTSEGESTEATKEETETEATEEEATEAGSTEEATAETTEEEAGESTETEAEGDKPGDEEKSFATKSDLEAMKTAILAEIKTLIGKSESEEENKEEEEKTEKSVEAEDDKVTKLEKTVEALTSEVKKLSKVAVTKRKTAVEVDKFDGDSEQLTKETMDKELAEIDKKYPTDPQMVFAKRGEIRRKYAKLGIR